MIDVECSHTLLEALENMILAHDQLRCELKRWFNKPQKKKAWEILRKSCGFVSGWLEHGKMDARDKPRVKAYLDLSEEFLTNHSYLK